MTTAEQTEPTEQTMDFKLSHDVVSTCAKRDEPPSRKSQKTMDFKLPHDVVCTCAKRDEPPSRRQPFGAFVLNVLFYQ